MSPIAYANLVLLLCAVLLALWRGELWERAISGLLIAVFALTVIVSFDFVTPPWVAIAADCVVFLVLLYACLRSQRRWIIFAASFQFLVLATHYVFVNNDELMQWAYVSAYYVWNIGLIISLCLGTVLEGRRPNKSSDERRD